MKILTLSQRQQIVECLKYEFNIYAKNYRFSSGRARAYRELLRYLNRQVTCGCVFKPAAILSHDIYSALLIEHNNHG